MSNNAAPSPAPTKAAGAPQPFYTLVSTAKLNEVDLQAWLTRAGRPKGFEGGVSVGRIHRELLELLR
jgi:hypothetical protein